MNTYHKKRKADPLLFALIKTPRVKTTGGTAKPTADPSSSPLIEDERRLPRDDSFGGGAEDLDRAGLKPGGYMSGGES